MNDELQNAVDDLFEPFAPDEGAEPAEVSPEQTYTVCGPHSVRGVPPGEAVALDPQSPETQRLLARGQIARDPEPSQNEE